MFKHVAIFLAAFCVSTSAADPSTGGGPAPIDATDAGVLPSGISELRAGWLYHDAGIVSNKKEAGSDGNAEVLFTSPGLLAEIWSPRPHIGTSLNTSSETSQVYGGLTWTYDLTESLFGDLSFGPSFNDGRLDKRDHERKALGSHVLFRESLSAGARFDEVNSISLMLDHISNGGLARYNGGMETLGLRYGYRF